MEKRDSVCKTLPIYHGDLLIRWLVEVFIWPQPFTHLSHNSIICHNSTWNAWEKKSDKTKICKHQRPIVIRSIGQQMVKLSKECKLTLNLMLSKICCLRRSFIPEANPISFHSVIFVREKTNEKNATFF